MGLGSCCINLSISYYLIKKKPVTEGYQSVTGIFSNQIKNEESGYLTKLRAEFLILTDQKYRPH